VRLAEQLLPRLKSAEWRDRAEAAVEQIETVDLRDLRSVVTASDTSARDDESRALAEQLRTGLLARVEHDHGAWLQELAETLADGRVARALNLSSRPPKAGAPLPRDLADRLAAAASAGLTSDVGQKRWQTVLESVARSPVRQSVVPEGIPSSPTDELLETVRNLSMQVPQIAAAFDIEPQRPSRKRRRSRKSQDRSGAKAAAARKPDSPSPAKPTAAPRIPPPPDLPADQAKPPAASGEVGPEAPAEPEAAPAASDDVEPAAEPEPASGSDAPAEPEPPAGPEAAPAASDAAGTVAEAETAAPEDTETPTPPEAAAEATDAAEEPAEHAG
jgi:hypothetical protein